MTVEALEGENILTTYYGITEKIVSGLNAL